MYTLIFDKKKIELPKLTRKIVSDRVSIAKKAIEQAKNNYDYDLLIEEMYDYISNLIGIDALKSLIEHNDIEDVDPNDLELLFLEIKKTYDFKKENYQAKNNVKTLNEIAKTLPTKELELLNNLTQNLNNNV